MYEYEGSQPRGSLTVPLILITLFVWGMAWGAEQRERESAREPELAVEPDPMADWSLTEMEAEASRLRLEIQALREEITALQAKLNEDEDDAGL